MPHYPELAMYALWTLWAVSWIVASGWTNSTQKRPPVSGEILYRILTFVGFGHAVLFSIRAGSSRVAAMAHARCGRLVVYRAYRAVACLCVVGTHPPRPNSGSARVTRKEGHHVIDTGPYRIVRHPIYTALLSAALWLALDKGTVWSLCGFALLTTGYFMKARIEERFLKQELGTDAYGAYARRVAMLVPFVARSRRKTARRAAVEASAELGSRGTKVFRSTMRFDRRLIVVDFHDDVGVRVGT